MFNSYGFLDGNRSSAALLVFFGVIQQTVEVNLAICEPKTAPKRPFSRYSSTVTSFIPSPLRPGRAAMPSSYLGNWSKRPISYPSWDKICEKFREKESGDNGKHETSERFTTLWSFVAIVWMSKWPSSSRTSHGCVWYPPTHRIR